MAIISQSHQLSNPRSNVYCAHCGIFLPAYDYIEESRRQAEAKGSTWPGYSFIIAHHRRNCLGLK